MKINIFIAFFALLIIFVGCSVHLDRKSILHDTSIIVSTDSSVHHTAVLEQTREIDTLITVNTELSLSSQIMVKACDNYIEINPNNSKLSEVLILKASVFYNADLFEHARTVYKAIIDAHKESPAVVEATRLVAQSYYEEKQFDKAQIWYRKLRDIAKESDGNSEAVSRIAESIYRMAEIYEKQQQFNDAAAQYERVALEFPDVSIADISLYNSGLSYEKLAEWSHAILMYQRLKQRYISSNLIPKSMFRVAKCYTKLGQWDNAAQTYLRLVANYPMHELTSSALYNAGFSFENANKLFEAAATFEKLAQSFPKSEDAPDLLFKAGELYGKLKEWHGVSRVNQDFSRRYGDDKNRAIQAQCMVGVAFYMQDKKTFAINQLKLAVTSYDSLANPSTVNKFYAAKAQYTLAEIYHEMFNDIKLKQPQSVYRKLLKSKSSTLDVAVDAYTNVIQYNIAEWTTRAIYQIGQIYEDFAMSIFKQERPKGLSVQQSLAFELGVAQAVEEYFVNNALHYHEQNLKLGIKENLEDKHILNSRKKLTYLPFVAGKNYLSLVKIARSMENDSMQSGFALIAQKLQLLQKIAPFQERAIVLFLRTLELGAMYQEQNDFYDLSSKLITEITYMVAETYRDVADVARTAPTPSDFDSYERFVYQVKLLTQIQEYEDNALDNYIKTSKIAEAYELVDTFTTMAQEKLAKLLFTRGRSYDLLCIGAFNNPPYPDGINEIEKEEYRARFEEVALGHQEQAFDIYQAILDYAKDGFASGDYVTHAYVRLYQNYPKEFGIKKETVEEKNITSGSKWKCTYNTFENWEKIDFSDQSWSEAMNIDTNNFINITGFPNNKTPIPMWFTTTDSIAPINHLFFRSVFYLKETPYEATLYFTASDDYTLYFNEERLEHDSLSKLQWKRAGIWDLKGKVRRGKNVIAVEVTNNLQTFYGIFPLVAMRVASYEYIPQPPGMSIPMNKRDVAEGVYSFPKAGNFSP